MSCTNIQSRALHRVSSGEPDISRLEKEENRPSLGHQRGAQRWVRTSPGTPAQCSLPVHAACQATFSLARPFWAFNKLQTVLIDGQGQFRSWGKGARFQVDRKRVTTGTDPSQSHLLGCLGEWAPWRNAGESRMDALLSAVVGLCFGLLVCVCVWGGGLLAFSPFVSPTFIHSHSFALSHSC